MNLPLCLFSWDNIPIPEKTDNWRGKPEHRLLITELIGEGVFSNLGMHCSSHGIWFGYEVDDSTFIAIHNAACIKAMGLVGAAGIGMPAWCPTFDSESDLTIAYNHPIPFSKYFRLYMGNSIGVVQHVKALHVYFDADPKEIQIKTNFLQPSWVV